MDIGKGWGTVMAERNMVGDYMSTTTCLLASQIFYRLLLLCLWYTSVVLKLFAVLKLSTIHVLYMKIHACIQMLQPGPSQAVSGSFGLA